MSEPLITLVHDRPEPVRCAVCDEPQPDLIFDDGEPICRRCIDDAVKAADMHETLRGLFPPSMSTDERRRRLR